MTKDEAVSMGWFLTYDNLYNKILNADLLEMLEGEFRVEFRLFDDDGIHYFSGRMTERLYNSHRILDPLDETENSYGCTSMQVWDHKTCQWEVV